MLGAPLLLAACGGDDGPAPSFGPLRSDFLTPLRLDVASVEVGDAPAPGPLDAQNPSPPGPALRQLGQDRLAAGGTAGRAVFTIDKATVNRLGESLEGVMAAHLEIFGADGAPVGVAEAQVTRRVAGVGGRGSLRLALYEVTRLMLADMNVELEFQVRKSLRAFLQAAETAPGPAPVEKQDLAVP